MKEHEVKEQMERITKYRALERVRDEIYTALKAVTEPWKNGPCEQGPFTGNARESRQVRSMHIQFTATRGGAAAVNMEITNMHIEASELGEALQAMLLSKLEAVTAEMERI